MLHLFSVVSWLGIYVEVAVDRISWTAKQSVVFSKSVKKSVRRGVRVLRARSA